MAQTDATTFQIQDMVIRLEKFDGDWEPGKLPVEVIEIKMDEQEQENENAAD